jgi:hypothetical protein
MDKAKGKYDRRIKKENYEVGEWVLCSHPKIAKGMKKGIAFKYYGPATAPSKEKARKHGNQGKIHQKQPQALLQKRGSRHNATNNLDKHSTIKRLQKHLGQFTRRAGQ